MQLSSYVGPFAPVAVAVIHPRRRAVRARRTARPFLALTGARLGCTAMSEALEHALRQSEAQRLQLTREVAAYHVTERRLLEQGERFRTTLASIGDAVIATDVDARITGMNAVAEALTGWTAADARDHRIEADRREAQNEVGVILERITDAVTRFDRDWRVIRVHAHPERMCQRSGTRGTR